jgi:hypothetical protein
LRSEARDAITPISSSCSSSSKDIEVSDGRDLLRGLAADSEDVDRFSPRAAAALGLRDFVIREERAGVAWSDMVLADFYGASVAKEGMVC